jgi:pimeloyl-ACP methyl ester carboxylesterase
MIAGVPTDRSTRMSTPETPVIFIHGLWLHASSWQSWIDHFDAAGYSATAPGWPGDEETVEAARANPEAVADKGIDDVAEHYAAIFEKLPSKPIVIGHSFGGMIAEKLLGENLAVAAIGIDAAQIKGVLPLPLSALRVTFPVFKNPANLHRSLSLTKEQFHYGFGNAIPEDESNELYDRWTVPSPCKPLFQAAAANFTPHSEAAVDTKNDTRGPLLLVTGGKDHTVPGAITRSTFKQYRTSEATTEILEFEDRGHSLTIDHGWQEIADASLAWLKKQGL